MITVLAPKDKGFLIVDQLINEKLLNLELLPSFSQLALDFLSQLSNKIFEVKHITNFPELVALAYWIRKANISSIIKNFQKNVDPDSIITPRGIAFHIAPSNVDSIFLYSWALSMLVGNINIIRITQNYSPQIALLLLFINDLMKEKQWEEITERNIIITYAHDDKINERLSSIADVRVLWGGDSTVQAIRKFSTKPTTKEVPFSDKFSYTVIDSKKYIALNDYRREQLAKQFYNDSYWFDQLACSSPRFVYFSGIKKKNLEASHLFWDSLSKELQNRETSESMGLAMNKLVYMYETASVGDSKKVVSELNIAKPTVIRIDKNEINSFRDSCGGGFFFETFIESLDELSLLTKSNDQTLTYFGFNKAKLRNLIKSVNGKGIDRVVPIGHALNFSPLWDGYSLLDEFTRKVHLL
ncbi:MAG TPA: acyl-CoA reductase [Ignavibacteriaceae bacterium]|nr:acyl-CoA reductase [Ignavibacteriaceae bacterium]